MIPSIPRIGRSPQTARLYAIEERLEKLLKDAAQELGTILGHSERQFWSHSMPEYLAHLLVDHQGGEEAAAGAVRWMGTNRHAARGYAYFEPHDESSSKEPRAWEPEEGSEKSDGSPGVLHRHDLVICGQQCHVYAIRVVVKDDDGMEPVCDPHNRLDDFFAMDGPGDPYKTTSLPGHDGRWVILTYPWCA